jgi:hypothetical protein
VRSAPVRRAGYEWNFDKFFGDNKADKRNIATGLTYGYTFFDRCRRRAEGCERLRRR